MPNPSAGLLEGINTSMGESKIVVGVGGAALYGITLQDWVAIATLTFVVLQIVLLIPKYLILFKNIHKRFPFLKKWFRRLKKAIKRWR